jgi:SAM-dependent methyltransferase
MNCRHCYQPLSTPFIDLGSMPPSNAYLNSLADCAHEKSYPLKVWVCDKCWLVQTEDYNAADELFTDNYAYFSSTSSSWLEHAKRFTQQAIDDLSLTADSFVVELAANDGYLLQNFVQKDIPCLGIEPTADTAAAARLKGIEIVEEFFGEAQAKDLMQAYGKADLIVANNVLAHVPDINDFVKGIACLLKPSGVLSVEFPHLLNLIQYRQFDTIYHEHYSYLSIHSVKNILQSVGLDIFKIEKLPTHGGSLRVWACLDAVREIDASVHHLLNEEIAAGLNSLKGYANFQVLIESVVHDFKKFIQQANSEGKTLVAYGAAAKGNTFLNYLQVKQHSISAVFDAAASKQGKYLPGSHIPILPPQNMATYKPDYVIILPWNIRDEVITQCKTLVPTGCQFVTAIPELKIV